MFRFLTAIREASQDRAEGAVADALSARIKQATERILSLCMAVQHKQHETIDWLLENGASPSMLVLNEDNFTPLTLSVRNGDPSTVDSSKNKT